MPAGPAPYLKSWAFPCYSSFSLIEYVIIPEPTSMLILRKWLNEVIVKLTQNLES